MPIVRHFATPADAIGAFIEAARAARDASHAVWGLAHQKKTALTAIVKEVLEREGAVIHQGHVVFLAHASYGSYIDIRPVRPAAGLEWPREAPKEMPEVPSFDPAIYGGTP